MDDDAANVDVGLSFVKFRIINVTSVGEVILKRTGKNVVFNV